MEKIVFDSGIKEYEINNNGVLRFNPSDPNVYARFVDAAGEITKIEEMLVQKAKEHEVEEDGTAALRLLAEADKQIKEILNGVFGNGNDFDVIMGGVNLMAVATNGERVITNLIQALMPIMEAGAKLCSKQQVDNAVQQARLNRAARRAQK